MSFKTEEDKQLYEERIEKKISAEERLPGDMYNMQTTMENKDNMIARLEKELSTVQSKKTKAIEALAKLRLGRLCQGGSKPAGKNGSSRFQRER